MLISVIKMLRSSRAISVWARDSQDKCKSCSIKDILEVYAKRWRIENKLAELVAFFNLNALSSPIMIRIHFDILWTLIADTLYHRFAHDLRRFETNVAPTIFRKFIDMPGRVIYDSF